MNKNSADDIRALGWMVVCHNDYFQNGELRTFWSFSRGKEYIRGEGKTDEEALDSVRIQLGMIHEWGDPHRTFVACLLIIDDRPNKPQLTEQIVKGWTKQQRVEAHKFAIASHLKASDNKKVKIPPSPAVLDSYI